MLINTFFVALNNYLFEHDFLVMAKYYIVKEIQFNLFIK